MREWLMILLDKHQYQEQVQRQRTGRRTLPCSEDWTSQHIDSVIIYARDAGSASDTNRRRTLSCIRDCTHQSGSISLGNCIYRQSDNDQRGRNCIENKQIKMTRISSYSQQGIMPGCHKETHHTHLPWSVCSHWRRRSCCRVVVGSRMWGWRAVLRSTWRHSRRHTGHTPPATSSTEDGRRWSSLRRYRTPASEPAIRQR